MASLRSQGYLVLLSILSVFVSAFLLFAAQPVLTRLLQPRYGGSPAVWNSVMLSFQFLLLAGYTWAHVGLLYLDSRRQRLAQVVLLVAPLFLAVWLGRPLMAPSDQLPVVSIWPFVSILGLALATAALPVLALASNAPMVQGWYAQLRPGGDPYRLYAASNLGSLAALLLYPLVIEPLLGTGKQLMLWGGGYILFAGVTFLLSLQRPTSSIPPRPLVSVPTTWAQRGRWLGLSALGSALLMAVSLHINTDLASLPLLWVAPLGIYLATFVVAFGQGVSARARRLLGVVASMAISISLSAVIMDSTGPFLVLLSADLLALATGCLLAHGDLAALRPPPERLGTFYLWVSLGGALGGVASTLVAPVLFESVVEYPLALALTAFLVSTPLARRPRRPGLLVVLPACAVLGCLLTAASIGGSDLEPAAAEMWQGLPIGLLLLGMFFWSVRWQFGAVALAVALLAISGEARLLPSLDERRTFFGVLRVEESNGLRTMLSGSTLHGSEMLAAGGRGSATTYYHPESPMGAMTAEAEVGERVCVVGLGVGALAAQVKSGVRLSFFEVDPMVEELALEWFSFLKSSRGEVEVVLGDARLTLERLEGPRCNTLIVDAFSSDSIPVHLLTEEAMEVYRQALVPSGRIMVHITNRHLDLSPVLFGLAASSGWQAAYCGYVPSPAASAEGAHISNVVALGLPPLSLPACTNGEEELPWLWELSGHPARQWTDDHASVLPLLWAGFIER